MNWEMDTNILFVRPGFLRGVARVIDFWGDMNSYNISATEEEADRLAFESDLLAISKDLRGAIQKFEKNSTHLSVQD